MNKLMNRNKNKKGFTLVEVIVVLVILAILAAILIPSMIGWIDKANSKTAAVEARSILLAAQTEASDQYAKNPKVATVDSADVLKLAEVGGTLAADPTVSGGKVQAFVYTNAADDYTVTCTAGKLGDPVKK